jgi:general secretion pathway protein G
MNIITKKSQQQAFTLIELLIVVAIIGLLSSIVLVSLRGAAQRAKIGKARAEITAIYKAILLIEIETGEYPHVNNINSASDFNTRLAPYITVIKNDPWGNSYFYDGCPEPCASCSGSGWDAGCESGLWQTSVCSGGLDGIISSHNRSPIEDDICIYFDGGASW